MLLRCSDGPSLCVNFTALPPESISDPKSSLLQKAENLSALLNHDKLITTVPAQAVLTTCQAL